MGVLDGVKVLEIGGMGPGPFCGMLLADMGAQVTLIERADGKDTLGIGDAAIFNRGKRSLALDLKNPLAVDAVLRLAGSSDVLIEGMRPGVMERLGLGPEVCLQRNPALVYGRMTGWGQTGPLAQRAGHDINYIALSGALWFSGMAGTIPTAPPTLVGDLGGGALYLAVGVLAALLHARQSGVGQVVDAAIVDGSANLMNLLLSLHAAGQQPLQRGTGMLDGPHWYGSYQCQDGAYLSVGPIEPQFSAIFLEKMGLSGDPDFSRPWDKARWPQLRARLAQRFAEHPQSYWNAMFDGTDACVAPVLDPEQAAQHPHLQAREVYSRPGGILQAAPAPRFSRTPSRAGTQVPQRGAHGDVVLREAGFNNDEILALMNSRS